MGHGCQERRFSPDYSHERQLGCKELPIYARSMIHRPRYPHPHPHPHAASRAVGSTTLSPRNPIRQAHKATSPQRKIFHANMTLFAPKRQNLMGPEKSKSLSTSPVIDMSKPLGGGQSDVLQRIRLLDLAAMRANGRAFTPDLIRSSDLFDLIRFFSFPPTAKRQAPCSLPCSGVCRNPKATQEDPRPPTTSKMAASRPMSGVAAKTVCGCGLWSVDESMDRWMWVLIYQYSPSWPSWPFWGAAFVGSSRSAVLTTMAHGPACYAARGRPFVLMLPPGNLP